MTEQHSEERLVVGQTLLYVPNDLRRSEPREVTVTKIGRKWADISGGYNRISITTLDVDGYGYSSPGKCWRSREAYESHKKLCEAWSELRRLIDAKWYVPEGVTLSQIENAKRSLFKGVK